ncbi:DedA family protein [Pseudomonas aeruginosa]
MLRRLYDWTLRLAGHPRAELALGGVTFAESSFFPIPPDALLVPMVLANRAKALLVPMVLANRAKAWRYAAICAISSVLGGIAGYFIGLLLFESVAMPILAFYGLLENFEQVAERYNELGWLMVLLGGGFTPLPYKVITITSGVTQLDLWLFVGLSLVARSLRFAATCALLFWAGPRLKTLIERRLGMAFVLMAVMVVGGLMLGKYVL